MTKQFTPDLKLKAVNYYHKINNYVKVCEVFECSERSLKRWVERYDKNKNVDRKTRKLGSYKLEKQHIQFIKETLRKHSDIQMNFLQELLKSKFPKLDNPIGYPNENNNLEFQKNIILFIYHCKLLLLLLYEKGI
jgi:transposase